MDAQKKSSYFSNGSSNTTPHNNQLEEYKFYYGESFKENKIWRLIALISISSFFIVLGILLYTVKLPKTIPVLITVNEQGEAKYVGSVSRFSYQNIVVPEQAIQYQVSKFIHNLYTVSTDVDVINANIKEFNAMLVTDAANKLSIMLKENSPYADFGNSKKNAFIETVLKLSNQTYQIDFIVTTTAINGQLKDRWRYRAVIMTKLYEPLDKDKEKNPLGIYITDFDITPIKLL